MAKSVIKINKKGEDGYKIISVRIKEGTLQKIDDLSNIATAYNLTLKMLEENTKVDNLSLCSGLKPFLYILLCSHHLKTYNNCV